MERIITQKQKQKYGWYSSTVEEHNRNRYHNYKQSYASEYTTPDGKIVQVTFINNDPYNSGCDKCITDAVCVGPVKNFVRALR